MTTGFARFARGLATALTLLFLLPAPGADAATTPNGADLLRARGLRLSAGGDVVHGGLQGDFAKAATDTVLVMGPWGSGAPYNGQFENPGGGTDWNGWTSIDLTMPSQMYWHADTYGALDGTHSAWCGTLAFPPCNVDDPPGGYGNNWKEILEWRGTVTDPGLPCTVTVDALVRTDTEPGYDYCYFSIVKSGQTLDLWTQDGAFGPALVSRQATYEAGTYEGPGGDEVVVRFRFTSDGGWSDADCSFYGDGAFYLDDLTIGLDNGTGYSHDFEDGALGALTPVLPQGVGDFAQLWTAPETLDTCVRPNMSPQVIFIDDGVVVPGTGGSPCLNWCYGPGGFIVNNQGGLVGPNAHLDNAIVSPAMAWPGPNDEGGLLEFDAWEHETLGAGSPGMFYTWYVRSTTDADPAGLESAPWLNRGFVHYGGPRWNRQNQPVGDLIPAAARWVQIQLEVIELGWVWGFVGTDGTPAPYFDNVRLAAFPYAGPNITCSVPNLPHDAFPEGGRLDLADLGANNVRFDTGADRAFYLWQQTLRNVPGDSVTLDIKPAREGAALVGMPRLHWNLKRNPLFDAYRTAGLPDQGWVEGWPAPDANGNPVVGRFAFDLPDSGFLFPGDFLYYYFSATSDAGGDVRTATLPADTSGFSNFDDPMAYPPIYKLHALPTITGTPGQPATYAQPSILFWDDGAATGYRDDWYMSFANLGLVAGVDYDIYYTSSPRTGSGQGLGGRATVNQVAGYTDMLYTSGQQTFFTLSDSTNSDKSKDVQLLEAWLQLGGRDLFLCGDDLVGGVYNYAGTPAIQFTQDWMGVDLTAQNVLTSIDNQIAPLVVVTNPSGVFSAVNQWEGMAICSVAASQYYGGGSVATGGRAFDGITVRPGAVRLAEFAAPDGAVGVYNFSAATLNVRADYNARVISLPYDLQSVWTQDAAKAAASLPARTRVLGDILAYFNAVGSSTVSDVPGTGVFAARNHPNPFNPATTISWSLPRAGHLALRIYDLRGRLVRTLLDEPQPAGPGQVRWDGRGADGAAAAAGVYFYRLEAAGRSLVGKMALIK